MNIIVGKLFIETGYWNWLAGIVNIASLLFYYICVIGGNTAPIAEIFQPEITGQYFIMMYSGKSWCVLLVLPLVALLPDLSYMLIQKIFFPTPTDAVMLRQQKQPDYTFDGFSDVFIPQLPDDLASQKLMAGQRKSFRQTSTGGPTTTGPVNQSQQLPLSQVDESVFETNNNSRLPLQQRQNQNQLQDFSD